MEKIFDTIILGGGPAGLSAGVYCARGNINCAIIDTSLLGGQPTNYLEIENYLGFPSIEGWELSEKFEQHLDKFNVEKFTMEEIQSVDLISNPKVIKTLKGEYKAHSVIIATGARAFVPPIKNANLPNVFTLRKIEDAIAIKEKALSSKHATIVGGGYIGIELLEAFVKQNLYVTLVEYSPNIMSIFDDDMSELILNQLNSINNGKFEILTSNLVTEFSGDTNGVNGVRTSTGKYFDTDFVVVCTGVVPNVDIAREAGIVLSETGAIKVNEKMETSECDIYACGDCVDENLLISNTRIWLPLGSNANKEGRS